MVLFEFGFMYFKNWKYFRLVLDFNRSLIVVGNQFKLELNVYVKVKFFIEKSLLRELMVIKEVLCKLMLNYMKFI